jgi:hypothetical protein
MMVRPFNREGCAKLVGVVWLGVLLSGPGAWAQAPAAPPASQPASARNLIKLNEGIRAYLEEAGAREFPEARRILEELRQEEPDNATCLYYLGLTYLGEGLGAIRGDEPGRAQEWFAKARECLLKVAELVDPKRRDPELRLAPVKAMLDLGIAQLASEDITAEEGGAPPRTEKEQKKRRSRRRAPLRRRCGSM